MDSRLGIGTRVLGECLVCVPEFSGASGGQGSSFAGGWNLLAEPSLTSLAVTAGIGGTLAPSQRGSPRRARVGKVSVWGKGRSFVISSYLALQVTQLHFHSILSITSTSQAHSSSRERTSDFLSHEKPLKIFFIFVWHMQCYYALRLLHPRSWTLKGNMTLVHTAASLPSVLGRGRRKTCAARDAAVGGVGLILAPSPVVLARMA